MSFYPLVQLFVSFLFRISFLFYFVLFCFDFNIRMGKSPLCIIIIIIISWLVATSIGLQIPKV